MKAGQLPRRERPLRTLQRRFGDAWFDALMLTARRQAELRTVAEEIAGNVIMRMSERLEDLRSSAGVVASRAIGRAGVASRHDLDVLSRRISKLAMEVELHGRRQRRTRPAA